MSCKNKQIISQALNSQYVMKTAWEGVILTHSYEVIAVFTVSCSVAMCTWKCSLFFLGSLAKQNNFLVHSMMKENNWGGGLFFLRLFNMYCLCYVGVLFAFAFMLAK